MPRSERAAGLLYVLPGFGIFVLFIMGPILATVGLSLTEWNGVTRPLWVGLDNYARLARDARFLHALGNNALLLLFYTLFPIACGLGLSLGMQMVRGSERAVYRVLLFLPYIMPMAVIGVIWRWLYNPAFGPIDSLLTTLGGDAWGVPWLGDFDFALPAVGLVATWYYLGFCMVAFLSGIQRIDPNLFEAARLDGAGEVTMFRAITLPSLRPELRVVLLLTIISSVKVFDLIFVMTRGGPGDATLVANLYMYNTGFQLGRFGYAAAVALTATLIVLAMNLAIHRVMRDQA